MKSVISNQIYIYDFTPPVFQWCQESLTLTNPTWATLKRLGKDDTIRFRHVPETMALFSIKGNALILPFGTLNAIWPYIKNSPYELRFNDNGFMECKDDIITQPLYDYQEEAVNEIVKAKGGVLVGACGCGKTQVGLSIAHKIGRKFLWLTHTHDLLEQTLKRAKFLFPNMDVGTITEGKVNIGKDGAVATVQTLANIDEDIYKNEFDVVITDECHHLVSSPTLMKYFGKIINKIPARYKFGLTATPSRGDTMIKSMYAYIGCNQSGYFAPTTKIDKSRVNTLTAIHERVDLNTEMDYNILNPDGTFDYIKLIDFLSKNPSRNATICEKIIELDKENHKQLVLCSRVEQCETLYEKLLSCEVKCELLVGKITNKKRKEILEEKKEWNVIVASFSLAKEGLDLPILDTLHLVTPQKNKAIVVQSVGRIERVMDGKPQPVVYDYVDVNIPYCVSAYSKRKTQIKRRY